MPDQHRVPSVSVCCQTCVFFEPLLAAGQECPYAQCEPPGEGVAPGNWTASDDCPVFQADCFAAIIRSALEHPGSPQHLRSIARYLPGEMRARVGLDD